MESGRSDAKTQLCVLGPYSLFMRFDGWGVRAVSHPSPGKRGTSEGCLRAGELRTGESL